MSKPKDVDIWNEVQKVIKEAATNSTSHGLPNIARADVKLLKVCWLVFILISTSGCVHLSLKNISSYLQFDVITNIKVLNDIPATFFTVTICNMNPIISNFSIEFSKKLMQEFERDFAILGPNNINPYFMFYDPATIAYYQGVVMRNFIVSNPSDEVKSSFTVSFNESLLFCVFNGQDCYPSNFTWYFDVTYGNCYKFNAEANQSFKEKRPGYRDGLMLELIVPEPVSQYSFAKSLGAQIFINNRSVIPFYGEGVAVAVGTQTNIAVHRVVSSRKSKPYSDCVEDIGKYGSVFTDAFLKQGVKYRQMDCFNYCYQRAIVNNCSWFN